jgi:hypothetical protein
MIVAIAHVSKYENDKGEMIPEKVRSISKIT